MLLGHNKLALIVII